MAEHNHAAVLRAIANRGTGAAEYFGGNGEWHRSSAHTNPLTHADLEWRIKPEPKPDRVFYNMVTRVNVSDLLEAEHYQPGRGHNVRYTFDGETGKLKSAEVLS